MKKFIALFAFFAISSLTYGQIEVGVRGGLTLTSGYTDLPAANRLSNGLDLNIPLVNNKGDGMGSGFLVGVYAKKELTSSGLFVQADLNYTSFLLKQKATDVTLGYTTSFTQDGTPLGLPPELAINASGDIMLPSTKSESSLQGVNLNLLIGKSIADNKFRFYGGPNFLFVSQAEQTINYSDASATLGTYTVNGFPPAALVAGGLATAEQIAVAEQAIGGGLTSQIAAGFAEPLVQDLSEDTPAPNLKVKSMIISLDLGVGTIIPNTGLGIDVRYSVPVFTGVYENGDIDGFLGITSIALSYAILKPKKEAAVSE